MPAVNPVIAVVLGILTLAGAYVTGRFAFRAQVANAAANREVGAGQLALDIAKDQRREISDLKAEIAAERSARTTQWAMVREAWVKHGEWDQSIIDELERVDPGASRRVGRRPTIPLD